MPFLSYLDAYDPLYWMGASFLEGDEKIKQEALRMAHKSGRQIRGHKHQDKTKRAFSKTVVVPKQH
jgi:hypothetical protein